MEMKLKKVSVTVDSTLTYGFVNIISKQQKLTPLWQYFGNNNKSYLSEIQKEQDSILCW